MRVSRRLSLTRKRYQSEAEFPAFELVRKADWWAFEPLQ